MPVFGLCCQLRSDPRIGKSPTLAARPATTSRGLRERPWTALFALVLLLGCSEAPAHPNILLITVDTLRADHLSLAADPADSARPTSPRLDALAADGVVFLAAASPRAKTTPAIASLMTGLYPHEHGVRDLTSTLPGDVPVLAEALRRAGYATGAIIGNTVLRRELAGLDRGFDLWVQDLPQTQGVPPDDVPQRIADSLTDGALSALGLDGGPGDLGADRPWFLWLHYMDPHGLYDPPSGHRLFERDEPEYLPSPPDVARPAHRQWVAGYNVPDAAITPDGAVDVAVVRDLYDGEIHFADAEIGRLLDRLADAGRLDDTLVVVTSDHGESLGEHDYWFEHGRYAYEPTTRVPLILRLPAGHADADARGARSGTVSLVDLAPTLLDLVGADPLPGASDDGQPRGRARVDLLRRDSARPHPVYYEKVEAFEQ
ncbi:MAG: sulfatase, partial [Planctomycetota bacterium]